jgi:predicted N-formylglutamate amidohydrolase
LGDNLADSTDGSTPLLSADEAPPYFVRNPGAAGSLVLVGDHAGRDIPRRLAGLGLPAAALDGHIAWDIGVAGLGARLADRLGAVFVAQRYSRLVIDCNRDPARADSICEVSDRVAIPGNVGLSAPAKAARVREIFEPYHARIAAELDGRGGPVVVASVHSFTPVLAGEARPWRFGVLHLGNSPFSQAMLNRLRAALGEASVGDNQPYRMDGTDYTVPHHAVGRGLDYLELEVRQDLIGDVDGEMAAAALLAPLLAALAPPPPPGRTPAAGPRGPVPAR